MATLNFILERIQTKKVDYNHYDFTQTENNALTTFFDLAQEFDGIDDLYRVCVAIPKGFFNREARLYVIDPKLNNLVLVAKTEDPELGLLTPPPPEIRPNDHPYYSKGNSLVLTIRGKDFLTDQLPFKLRDNVIGLLEIHPVRDLGPHGELFFEKYANRIGFNIHNRFIVEKNIEHLRFIRSLVADIEHNIIAPNMIYKLYLRHLKRKIMKNVELEKVFAQGPSEGGCDEAERQTFLAELREVNDGLLEEIENIEKHYQNMTLFLETLLRRSHFETGHFTLRTRPCNMNKTILKPQIERFAERFRLAGIEMSEQSSGIPDEDVISVVDVGLMAQVYANLFSNALKYTEEVVTHEGEKKKYMAYGREIIRDFFGPGKDGIKYNVFTTGPHVPPAEREKIFEDEYRGSNSQAKPGTGHGLSFIKNAVEMHHGVVGYEPTQYGNNFYFVLPK
ncbi:MAG TPA: ATP-binding protein [Thermodesulfovibrionales bacterium]|jgi:signal transduction histidine kinase|nr:ATP-binding protein [Thermodesulfovibrionales bacterium]